jgi:2Fe-2S ferredoxin
MVRVRYLTPEGVREVEAEAGENLMSIGVRESISGIVGECGGEMSCGTCHVQISREWCEKFPPPSADEVDLLEMSDHYSEGSRLGCQVVLLDSSDGLEARPINE